MIGGSYAERLVEIRDIGHPWILYRDRLSGAISRQSADRAVYDLLIRVLCYLITSNSIFLDAVEPSSRRSTLHAGGISCGSEFARDWCSRMDEVGAVLVAALWPNVGMLSEQVPFSIPKNRYKFRFFLCVAFHVPFLCLRQTFRFQGSC